MRLLPSLVRALVVGLLTAAASLTVNINAGTYNVGLFAAQGGWNINWIKFTKQ